MKHTAFTMIETIIVMVLVGILTASIYPQLQSDPLRNAIVQVTRHITYTQHMAMVDDVYDAGKPLWFKAMWRISFRTKNCYVVSSNTDMDMNYDRKESAMDPLNKVLLYSNSKCKQEATDSNVMFLSEAYGIKEIVFSKGCGNNRFIAFDILGRPHRTLTRVDDYVKSNCEITFKTEKRKAIVTIRPETGFVTSKIF